MIHQDFNTCFLLDKWAPIDDTLQSVKARKKLRVQNGSSKLEIETRSTSDIFNGTLQFMN